MVITLDSNLMVARMPLEKLGRIRQTIYLFVRSPVCSKGVLQSLLGMLNHSMRIIPQGRAFVSRLLALLPLNQDSDSTEKLLADTRADLIMWDKFLWDWNGISVYPASNRFSQSVIRRGRFSWFFGHFWPRMVGQLLTPRGFSSAEVCSYFGIVRNLSNSGGSSHMGSSLLRQLGHLLYR